MDTTLINEIKDRFHALPDVLKSFIMNDSWMTNVESIASKFGLNPNQTEGLEQETLIVLMGTEPTKNFRANLVEELDVTYDQALKISYEMNARVFGPVTKALEEFQDVNSEKLDESDLNIESEARKPETKIDNVLPPEPETIYKPAEIPRPYGQAETQADHLLTDHETMEKTGGMHLHSQMVMPALTKKDNGNTKERSSIIDQKLNQIVRSGNDSAQKKENRYPDSDPYREPIN